MTEEELVKRFYEDIKQTSESGTWFTKLFEFPDNRATYREFFDVLPEPLREYAYSDTTKKMVLGSSVNLTTIFNTGFFWSACDRGKVWRRLNGKVCDKFRGFDVGEVTVEGLLA